MRLGRIYPLLFTLNLSGFPVVAAVSIAVGMQSSPASIVLRATVIAFSLILIVSALFRRRAGLPAGWYWVPIFMFWLAYIGRLAFSSIYESETLARDVVDYWLWAIGACLIPFLGMLVRIGEDVWIRARSWSFIALSVAAALVLLFGGTLVAGVDGDAYDTGRLRLDSLNPISVGHLGASLSIVSGWLLLNGRGRSSFSARGLWIGAALLGLFTMLAAASRGPIASLLFVGAFGAVALNSRNSWRALIYLAFAAYVAYLMSEYFDHSGQFSTADRILGMFGGDDVNVTLRQQAVGGAITQFLEAPVFGSALEERVTGYYPHNVIVEGFMAVGVFGGGGLLVLLFYGAWCSFQVLRLNSAHGWVSLLFIQYLIGAQFSSALYNATTMWALLGACICLYKGCMLTGHNGGEARVVFMRGCQ